MRNKSHIFMYDYKRLLVSLAHNLAQPWFLWVRHEKKPRQQGYASTDTVIGLMY